METLEKLTSLCSGKSAEFANEILAKYKDGTLTRSFLQAQQGKWLFAGAISKELKDVKNAAWELVK